MCGVPAGGVTADIPLGLADDIYQFCEQVTSHIVTAVVTAHTVDSSGTARIHVSHVVYRGG